MNIHEIRRDIEREIREADEREQSLRGQIEIILDNAKLDNRQMLTRAEDKRAELMFADIEKIRSSRGRLTAKLERALEVEREENEIDAGMQERHPTAAKRIQSGGTSRTATFSVTQNERTYSRSNDPRCMGHDFLTDVGRSFLFNDRRANERLDRHMNEERIERPGYLERAAGDANTSAFGVGLVVPQYLVDFYAPAVANMRPLANAVNLHPLPEQGMTLNLSRITTATSAGLQTSQLSAVSATSIAETDLSIAVQTAAGSQNVSRQAIERGTGIDQVVMSDLLKRVATLVDATLITQASTGIQAVAQGVTYTSASPTGAEMYPYIFQAESKLEQALLAQARVDTVVMHPRRWNWLCAAVGSTWPLLQAANFPGGSQTSIVQVTNEYGPSYRGVLANGLKVVVDANVPTNTGGTQDEVYVLASEEIHLWEDPHAPVMIRAEQPNAASLGVLLVMYEYFAYTAARYANNPSKITGTGLAAPAGF